MGYDKGFRNKYIKGGALIVGNSTIQGNLNVEGSMVFEDAISATSDVTINGLLKVVGNINSSGTMTAKTGVASSSGTLDVKTATVRNTLGVTKTLTASSGFLGTANSSFSGTLKVDNALTASSGFLGTANSSFSGTLKVDNALIMSSGLTEPIEAATTAALTLTPNGISTISAPTTGAASWTLGTPVAGCSKTIVLTAAASTLSRRNVLAASGIAILTTGSTTANKIRMFKEGDSVTLRGLSASLWAVTNMRGVTLFSASTTTT